MSFQRVLQGLERFQLTTSTLIAAIIATEYTKLTFKPCSSNPLVCLSGDSSWPTHCTLRGVLFPGLRVPPGGRLACTKDDDGELSIGCELGEASEPVLRMPLSVETLMSPDGNGGEQSTWFGEPLTWWNEELIGKTEEGPGAGTKWWCGLRTVFVADGGES